MSDASTQGGVMRNVALGEIFRGSMGMFGGKAVRIAGVIVLLAGLQTYGFYRHFVPEINSANANLDQLMNEVSTNIQMDKVLHELENLKRVAGDDGLAQEAVKVYERFIKEFLENRVLALEQFNKAVNAFPAPAAKLGAESLTRVKAGLDKINQIYGDHYSALVEDIDSTPFYLQPMAAFIKKGNALVYKVKFNHALYNSIVGDMTVANTEFNELKQEVKDPHFAAIIHYAQARMQYTAFKSESKFEYYQQAIANLQQSMKLDPDYGLPKMLLEYLLSVQGSASAANANVQGEGNGQAEGERGVISSESPNF